jgi:hypothetical protein
MIQKLKNFWHSLPPKVQTTILIFESAAGTFLATTLTQYLTNPSAACWKWLCLRSALAGAVLAGGYAAKNFWMRPGPGRAGGPAVEIPAAVQQ